MIPWELDALLSFSVLLATSKWGKRYMLSSNFNQKIVELYLGLKKVRGGGINHAYFCLYLLIFIP